MTNRPRKLILKCAFSLGDAVMVSAAVRDLHRCYPGRFLTDVRTSYPDLWTGNPYLTRLADTDRDVRMIECHCPLVEHSNTTPRHYIHGFIEHLNECLGLRVQPTAFKGDIHLTRRERARPSLVQPLTGRDVPFWILVAGGKWDYTIKWWDWRRFQEVVNGFRDRVLFVQVGDQGHYHPKLEGVIDFRGRTDLRELIRLVYHAEGVLCPVTALMHLAAAVDTRAGRPAQRPCVVVAGGREPPHWEAYPTHQFIHTVGALPCCRTGGCWRGRTVPLHDESGADRPDNLCVDVVGELPHCMDLIRAADVIRRMEISFEGGITRYLTRPEARAAQRGIARRTAEILRHYAALFPDQSDAR